MFKLPTTEKSVESTNPKNMLLYAHPKTGKTQALSGLQGNLIIDLEDGTEYVGGMVINVLAEAAKVLKLDKPKQVYGHPEGMNTVLNILFEINKQLKEGDTKYKFISLDTATALIDVATHLATLMYKKSPIGKNYAGTNVVMDLPNGGGQTTCGPDSVNCWNILKRNLQQQSLKKQLRMSKKVFMIM